MRVGAEDRGTPPYQVVRGLDEDLVASEKPIGRCDEIGWAAFCMSTCSA
jgi:hypothetical protein